MSREPFDISNLTVKPTKIFKDKHVARSTKEGREWLRERGEINRHSLDMTSRPFIAWDGEGITHGADGTPQSYCLFGASTGDYIMSPHELTSEQCFQFMLKVKQKYPQAIMFGFAFGYDSEMMLASLPTNVINRINQQTVAHWNDYRIEYIPKKWFQITGTYAGKKTVCKIWDVWSFFTCSLVKALKTYINVPDDDLAKIVEGKRLRGQFNEHELRTLIQPYMQMELKYMVQLMDKLRTLLNGAGLYPNAWHGPAALSNFLNKAHGTERHMNREIPDEVLDASQYAYAAGRVERCMVGRAWTRIYKYDLNSAYPAAMVECPSLAGRKWRYRTFGPQSSSNREWRADRYGIQKFGLYFIDYYMPDDLSPLSPQPLFHRTKDAFITFPRITSGWYWGPEVEQALLLNYMDSSRPAVIVHAAWELDMTDAEYPFTWIAGEYAKRLKMKEDGDESQLAVKLGLNSMYGKTAQRTGYDRFKQIPRWHQYEWAGYITSRTRARMHDAAMHAAHKGCLIGIETDAIFTTEPIPQLEIGKGLGQWGLDTYDDIVYLQTGVYWLLSDGKWQSKFRGMDADTLTIDMALDYLENMNLNVDAPKDYETQAMKGMTRTRFVGSKAALHRHKMEGFDPPRFRKQWRNQWRAWVTDDVTLNIGASFKRTHIPSECGSCKNGVYYASDTMHDLAVTNTGYGPCYASKLPWRTVDGQASNFDPSPEEDVTDPSFIP